MRVLAGVLVCLFALARAAGADPAGFIYVALDGTPPRVQVYSAATDALVTEFLLPARTPIRGMAISPDGSRLWVSCEWKGAAATLVEIDARHHTLIGSYPVAVHGSLAVQRDNSQVFVQTDTHTVYSFDTSTRALVGSISPPTVGGAQVAGALLSANPVTDVVYVGRWSGTGWAVTAYDAATLAPLAEKTEPLRRITGLAVSNDGARVHLLLSEADFAESKGGARAVLDASSLAATVGWLAQSFPYGGPVESSRTGELLTLDRFALLRFPLNAEAGPSRIAMDPFPLFLTLPSGERRAVVALSAPSSPLLKVVDLSANAVVNTIGLTGPIAALTSTPAAVASCTYRLDRRYSSFTVSGGTGSVRLTSDCAWQARSSASWVRLDTTSGTAGATIGITVDPFAAPPSGPYTPRSATVTIGGQLLTVTQAGGASQPPFGFIDTPAEGTAGITGSLAVTGWALDDVGVTRVRVYREAVLGRPDVLALVGTATFVDGARPDLRALFPSLPFAPRAGWGLMVLTNMLPNGGNGTFRLHVYAEDIEGQQALLGTRTITLANADATQPFGAIDTPSPGEEVSGVIVNWGWALTPPDATIPVDGSTIDVVVDGVVVGHPTYNLFRGDIAALFPGYSNTNGAVGYFVIDTRTMTNGIHSIAWVVRDDAGRARGMGSRYFSVFNE